MYGTGHCSGGTCMLWGKWILRVGTVLTVCVNFYAKRQENQNLILTIIQGRNFIFEGNSTLVLSTRKEKNFKFIVSLAK